jgi:hypothetical protein
MDFSTIYSNIKSIFFKSTGLSLQDGTVIDNYVLAAATALQAAYDEIESNKDPHIFTNLSGSNLDATGFMFNCPRNAGEQDDAYLYRILNWLHSAQACNILAINSALIGLQYASNAMYVPLTHGTSTASVYIIPTSYDGTGPQLAISEVTNRLNNVVSPGTYIEYVIPTTRNVRFVIYLDTTATDDSTIKSNLRTKIQSYVNSVAVGSNLELGEINKIGVNEMGVEYFNVVQTYINEVQSSDVEFLQTRDSKFLFDQITWWAVKNSAQ